MPDFDQHPSAPPATPPASGLSDNIAGGLSYFTIIVAIVFLFLEPYRQREFVRFHCFQTIFLTIASIVFGIFRFFGTAGAILEMVLGLAVFVVWIIALVQAFRGFKFMIPGIGPLAEKYAAKR